MVTTAQDVVELIDAHLGVPRRETTVDEFLAGDPEQEVHGVAFTMMATLEVLQRAVAQGLDLVVTHEPLFFNHREEWTAMLAAEADPVHAAKAAFIAEHRLVVRRLHDAVHDTRPDRIVAGAAHALGWHGFERADRPTTFDLPATTLGALADHASKALGAGALRYIGDPDLPVSVAGIQPGFWGFEKNRTVLADPDVDVLLIGESNEWETAAYAADAVSAGLAKGLIVIGHVPSEQQGMSDTADRLADLLPALPVAFIPTADPFRTA
ncbi:Nif3-like dinuclear metal center hexameric protein [Glycomyces paridis]|uniref:GTP cyclohydrolase 1 type 2 homolog n=1 Tax=Glycomyces paridis TaxID=2126555 RepID=A0A4S8PIN3_9ACTN|nr:Nif3-like dinuclear metal center hexameric protein [Glycomyces paridis]THV29535.1 NGG1p interacting factor NIF3 [Glycomyces paridis]